MNKIIVLLTVMMFINKLNAQNELVAYNDYTGHFKVFSSGSTYELEYTPITDFKVGGNAIGYTDQRSNFKIYYKGESNIYEEDAPTEVTATSNYLTYKMTRKLAVFDNGKIVTLTNTVLNYYTADSLVAWVNYPDGNFNVYENGKIKTIETAAVNKAVQVAKVGSNLVAYADLGNIFKIYYKDQTYTSNINMSYIKEYKCAANIVAYTDEYSNKFEVFYNGKFVTLENTLPRSFYIANDMVSYIDNIGNFKLFYAGITATLESFPPEGITAANNLLAYNYTNMFKVFYKGQIFTLENFIPGDVLYGVNAVLYTDAGGKLKFFYKGITYKNFFFELPSAISLSGDVPFVKYAINSVGFFYNGKMY